MLDSRERSRIQVYRHWRGRFRLSGVKIPGHYLRSYQEAPFQCSRTKAPIGCLVALVTRRRR